MMIKLKICTRLTILIGLLAVLAACSGGPQAKTESLSARAEQAYVAGDWQTAEVYYADLTKATPEDTTAWLRMGNMRLRQANYYGAIDAYQVAAESEHTGAKTHFNLATSYLMLARESLLKAREQLPEQDVGQMVIDAKLAQFDRMLSSTVAGVTMPESGVFQ